MENCMGNQIQQLFFFNFNCLATGIWDFKSQSQLGGTKKIVIKYVFILFKMTAQNTQSE